MMAINHRSETEASETLNRVADFLDKQNCLTPGGITLRNPDFEWVASCLRAYANGEAASLDIAFGLKQRRGQYLRPLDEDKVEMAKEAIWGLMQGKPFRTIAELNGKDEKTFRELMKRYGPEAIKRIAATIKIDMSQSDDGVA